jgi:hypothetical protein
MNSAKIETLTKSGGKSADLCRPKKRKFEVTMSHGMVLTEEQIKYDDLKEFGTITISQSPKGVSIKVDGFEFATDTSCRLNATKALHWARDLLTTQIEAEKLVPGGTIICSCD